MLHEDGEGVWPLRVGPALLPASVDLSFRVESDEVDRADSGGPLVLSPRRGVSPDHTEAPPSLEAPVFCDLVFKKIFWGSEVVAQW